MEALIAYMKLTGKSQVELAKMIGVNQGHLNHWLRKRRAPTVSNLKRISKATGISLENLAKDL